MLKFTPINSAQILLIRKIACFAFIQLSEILTLLTLFTNSDTKGSDTKHSSIISSESIFSNDVIPDAR